MSLLHEMEVEEINLFEEEEIDIQKEAENMFKKIEEKEHDMDEELEVEVFSVRPIPSPEDIDIPEGQRVTNRYKRSLEGRANSLAFEPILNPRTGEQLLTGFGDPAYEVVPVPSKPGHHYCTECHDYKKFKTVDINTKMCPDCGISTNDHYIKTANMLWKMK